MGWCTQHGLFEDCTAPGCPKCGFHKIYTYSNNITKDFKDLKIENLERRVADLEKRLFQYEYISQESILERFIILEDKHGLGE